MGLGMVYPLFGGRTHSPTGLWVVRFGPIVPLGYGPGNIYPSLGGRTHSPTGLWVVRTGFIVPLGYGPAWVIGRPAPRRDINVGQGSGGDRRRTSKG